MKYVIFFFRVFLVLNSKTGFSSLIQSNLQTRLYWKGVPSSHPLKDLAYAHIITDSWHRKEATILTKTQINSCCCVPGVGCWGLARGRWWWIQLDSLQSLLCKQHWGPRRKTIAQLPDMYVVAPLAGKWSAFGTGAHAAPQLYAPGGQWQSSDTNARNHQLILAAICVCVGGGGPKELQDLPGRQRSSHF